MERVRRTEAEYRADGIKQHVVVAVREDNDEVAALTEVIVHPSQPDRCYQGPTVVTAAHRGRGLGVCVKSRMARWLHSDRPRLERVQTSTSSDNVHMLRLNDRLGFRTVRELIAFTRELDELSAAVSAGSRAGDP